MLVVLFAMFALLYWAMFSRNIMHRGRKAVAKLPRGRFEQVLPYVEQNLPAKNFWIASNGIKGVGTRLFELKHIITALQMCVAMKIVPVNETSGIWANAALQVFYSFAAFPEALLCKLFPSLPHFAGLMALRHHMQVTLETQCLCQVQGAPDCLLTPQALL